MLTITSQAVNARRVLRTPRPATDAVRPATSLVTASLLASPVAVAARTATRFVHTVHSGQTDLAKTLHSAARSDTSLATAPRTVATVVATAVVAATAVATAAVVARRLATAVAALATCLVSLFSAWLNTWIPDRWLTTYPNR